MRRWHTRIFICLALGAVTTVAVAWSAWWEPTPSEGGENLSIDQASSLWQKCGGKILGADRVFAVRIPGRWLDRNLVLADRHGGNSTLSELRMIRTSGWPLRSMFQASQPPLQLRRIVFPRMNIEQAAALDANVAQAQQFFKENQYADAAALFREALKVSRQLLGMEHPGTVSLMASLARLLELEGRYAQAEVLRRGSLEIQLRIFGANSPRTAVSMSNLGLLLADQRRTEEATALFIGTLSILDQNPRFALVPMWFGFSVDALFYSIICFGLLLGFTFAKRTLRTRCGRCPMCKYDLRGDLDRGCPECGWNRAEDES